MKTFNRSVRGLEKKRGLFFRIGLVVSLLITFFAFEWSTPVSRDELLPATIWDGVEEELITVTYRNKEVLLPQPEPEKHVQDNRSISTSLVIVPDDKAVAVAIVDSSLLTDVIPIVLPIEIDTIDPETYLLPEIKPEFPGGEAALIRYLQSEIKYPENARRDGLTGAAYINFIIDETGNATSINIQHATNPVFSTEAMRVIDKMPLWSPGKQGGKKVKVIMTLPVTFRLL